MGSESIDDSASKQGTYGSLAPKAHREILIHAVFSGLTPLIPLPFVDDWARNGIQKRMVRKIADAYGNQLYEADVKALGCETGRDESLLFSAAKKLAFFPIKRIFRTTLFVLVIKDIVEAASRTYHVGYLLDYAVGQAWHTAAPPEVLRVSIDDVCRNADTSPVRRVFLSVFEESRDLLGAAASSLRTWLGTAPRQQDGGPRDAQRPKEVEAIADRLERAINVLPPEHFLNLRTQLEKALGVHGM